MHLQIFSECRLFKMLVSLVIRKVVCRIKIKKFVSSTLRKNERVAIKLNTTKNQGWIIEAFVKT